MVYNAKKVLLSLIAVVTILASLTLIFVTIIHPTAASAQTSISAADYTAPVSGGDPWGTAFDSSGRVWVALPGCDLAPSCPSSTPPGHIALFDPSSKSWVKNVALPSGYGQPLFVAVDTSGKVWFTMPVTNQIAVYDPSANTLQSWKVPTTSSGPWGIAIDKNGLVWFTEHYVNKIGSFNPTSHAFNEVATPATNSNPYGITVDASNNVWFTENTDAVALIGEYTQSTLKEYKIRNTSTSGTGLTPHAITIDQNGNIWWSEGWVSSIGVLKVASAQAGTNNGVTEYSYMPSCSNCGSHTSGISAGKAGYIWLDDSLQNTFGFFPISGSGGFTFYGAPTSGGHPHDGMNVDGQNRVWFDEEFADKLAVAYPSTTLTPTPVVTNTPTATPVVSATPGTILGKDTFQRANQSLWGNASDGQTWGGDANTQSIFSISNNTGQVSNGSSTYNAVLGPSTTDAEVLLTGSISAFSNSNFGPVVRWADTNNWYKAYIDGSNLILQKKVSGAYTTLTSTAFAAKAGTAYSIRFSVVGTTLSAKVWAATASEPTAWMVTATDSSLHSGMTGLRTQVPSGVTASFTSYQGDVPGGSSTPTPTPTATVNATATVLANATATASTNATATALANATATASANATATAKATVTTTATVTVTATATNTPTPTPTNTPTPTATSTPTATPTATATGTPSPTLLAQDTFQRANQSLWGVASDGQTWGGDANVASVFSIVSNTGHVTNTGTSYSAVLGASATNAEVIVTGSISNYTNNNFGGVLRWTDGNNWYKAYIDGTHLVIQKKVSGTTTILSSVAFTASAGTSYTIDFKVVGSTLSANVWASSGTEPSGWMATATDTTFTSGQCGMRILSQNATTTITSFVAKPAS